MDTNTEKKTKRAAADTNDIVGIVAPEKTPEQKRAEAIAKAQGAVSKAEAKVENARTEHDRTQAVLQVAEIDLAAAQKKLARLTEASA